MSNVLITQGTQTAIKTDTVGTELYQVIKLDIGAAGASSLYAGAGTVDTVGLINANAYGTVITTGTSVVGTIKAAVAGSQIFVTDLTIAAGSATNVEIGNGGTANNIFGTIYLNANGGIVSNFRTPLFTTAGSALVYKQSTNGPMTITAQGYVK